MAGIERSEQQLATLHLRAAIRDKPTAEVVRLLDVGADPNDRRGWTSPLTAGAEVGRSDVIEVLLERNADPTWVNRNGWTAATFADAHELYAIADRLVAAGAPAASRVAHGYADLHRAAFRGDPELAALLDGPGIDVDVVDAQGDSPLGLAIRSRHEAAAKSLLVGGADPGRVEDGWSVLSEAAYQDSIRGETTDFVGLLFAYGARPRPGGYPPTFGAINQEGSSGAVLRRLIEAGADIAARNEHDGETILHYIAAIEDGDLVDLALDLGAELDARDKLGRTPLLLAAMSPSTDAFLRLVDRGADLDARDDADESVDDLLPAEKRGDALRAHLGLLRNRDRTNDSAKLVAQPEGPEAIPT